jgi:hypothetical protein
LEERFGNRAGLLVGVSEHLKHVNSSEITLLTWLVQIQHTPRGFLLRITEVLQLAFCLQLEIPPFVTVVQIER